MLLQFFFLNLAILCAGVLLIIAVRAWPRLDGTITPKGAWERWAASDLPQRFDRFLNALYLRALRKIRVFALKVDNATNSRLERIKLHRGDSIVGQKPSAVAHIEPEIETNTGNEDAA